MALVTLIVVVVTLVILVLLDGKTNLSLLGRITEMENNMAIKVSEIKTAVALIAKNNKEAIAEIGTQIADLNKQIADLIAGVGDPTVTDAAFEADLNQLGVDAQALADIVPGSPTPPVA